MVEWLRSKRCRSMISQTTLLRSSSASRSLPAASTKKTRLSTYAKDEKLAPLVREVSGRIKNLGRTGPSAGNRPNLFDSRPLASLRERCFNKSIYGFANFIEGRRSGIEPKAFQEGPPLK